MSRKDRVEELFDRGQRLRTEGKYSAASSVLREAIQEAEWLPQNDLLRAEISNYLGFVLCNLGVNLEAERHFRIAVEVQQVALQPNDNDTAISLYMLGLTLQQQSKLEEAEAIGHRALEMFRLSSNKDDKHFAAALYNLGGTLQLLKKFQSAEAAYRESLEIEERLYGHNHQDTALTLNNLGVCLLEEGKYGEAAEILREVVAIESSLNVSPESREISLYWLLKSLNDDGKFQQAEEEYLRWFQYENLPSDNPKRKAVTKQIEKSLKQQGKISQLNELKRTARYTVQSAVPPSNVPDHSLQATAVSPTREPSHATGTVQAVSQLPQSPMQAFLASQGWKFDVFVCHAKPDRAFIAMLHAEMQKYGLKTFTDVKSMEKGSSVEMTVAHAIVKSPFFMVVLSHSFLTSLHCESEVEAALAFPGIHKKIIPVFYEMSVDGCLQTEKELYHRLAAITGLHKGYKTDQQFAESISQEVRQMAVEQLQSNDLKVWKPEGMDWKLEGSLDQLEQLFKLTDDMKHFKPVIESVLDSLGAEGRRHFLEAIAKGTMKIARVYLDLLGDGEAGKSSLGDSLMDEPFIRERESTEGANVIYMIQMATGYSAKWKKDEDRSYSLGCLLARGSVLSHDTVDIQSKAAESKAVLSQAQSLSGTQEDISTSSVTIEELESSMMSTREESSQVSDEGKQVVVFGEKEFQKAKELTEERAKAIKSLQNDPGELQKQNDLIHISVCDRGGQEHFLPIHTALIANCSEFIPKAYLLVFDLTKRLSEVANATFRAERGANKITYTRCRQVKNEEIIGRWASAVDLAHPESEMQQPGNLRPFLGQHRVRRGPAMFIIGTHYDEIVKRGEEGQELLKEQEMAVQKILSNHKYIERVVAADEEKNELIFKVDNTRSGTGSPDPMVSTIRELIFDMAIAYRDEMKATPLPYVVMELGLLNMSQAEGPDGTCDSDQKIVNIDNVVQLAEQYCDIKGLSRCQTALKYLSGVGAIFYFFKALGLTDKVFTDPQWLFSVMSTYVTILSDQKVSHLYWHDLKLLKEEGRMSRQLAEHLLERRPKLGVKPKHYNTIFRLLQLVDVFCPHQSSSLKLAIEDVKEFYVPCMLEVDYKEPTAWEMSSAADGVSGSCDSACPPPSLIFKPDNVDSIPEPLFFRLSSRTAYQFPEFPQLKRNRIQVYIDDSGLALELLYHSTTSQCVIATIFPNDKEDPPTPEVVNRQCTYVRRFLCWQLNDGKRNGMDGFQYKLYFQVGKKPGTMDVDEESLYLLPECDEMPKKIVHPRTKTCLKKKECLLVKSWYNCDAPECGGDTVLPTKADLVQVAESVQHQWRNLAGAMEPRPFYRNELIKFEGDINDNSESGKALRMLQEWQCEHKNQATTSNLKRSLAAVGLTHVRKVDSTSSYVDNASNEEESYVDSPTNDSAALGNLGVYFTDEGKSGEAVEALREAITVESSLNVSPASRENTLCGFPQSLNTDGKFEEAEGEYLEWPKFGDFPANNPKRRRVTEEIERGLKEQGEVTQSHELKETGKYTLQSAAPHSHATGTVKAVSQQPQSPMQVETGSGIAAEVERKLTADQEVEVAERIAGEWEKLVVYLSPEFFRPIKISEIKKTYGSPFLQAQAALAMWSDRFHGKATQYKVIKALCRIGCRAQAVEVFKDALVDFVAPM